LAPVAEPLAVGNAAKLYCLRWIKRLIEARADPIRILDLGCGRALNFVELLRRHPGTRYVGIEPIHDEARRARENLLGFDAEILEGDAYDAHERLAERFDIVVSFSVLEHVYRRDAYLRAARECLTPDGRLLINYDAGHFRLPSARDRVKNLVGRCSRAPAVSTTTSASSASGCSASSSAAPVCASWRAASSTRT
jgi:SAM-dependent methyltransferase